LFDEHELEKTYQKIDIDDKAFENIFKFFDKFEWHLDTRITATGEDINPDVIGYIFEKYINNRAKMGAYYTKEDITDYISKNCIIPFLLNETQKHLKISDLLKDNGDRYIYDVVKKGVNLPLPAEIEIGIDTALPNLLERRKEWNKPASDKYALPTEIWREVVERRNRYKDVKTKIEMGKITEINDFITYNLNIRQFAQDVIENTNDPEFLKTFYNALTKITILDPTCGSGAFLFAAMNILEFLYKACIQRMKNFVAESNKGKYKFFEEVLEKIKRPEHPNLKYFIYKSIILNNLYGVDIMKEAVEIAKLRLFLKLVATVKADYRKPNLGLEPLPDIDFNIRAGNTLIGYANKKEIDELQGMFITKEMNEQILEECDVVSRAFQRYKEIQINGYENKQDFTDAKNELDSRLHKLTDNLNKCIHKQHYEGIAYKTWLQTHQPFHWFAEFYEIVHNNGGFDVIIGNPPYVKMKKIDYKCNVQGFDCSNIYGYIIRSCFNILNNKSRYGFIVMHNLAFSNNFEDVRKILLKNATNAWFSFFARIPAGLFSGDSAEVRVRNCVFLMEKCENKTDKKYYTTRIHRWLSKARGELFAKLTYTTFTKTDVIPMFNSDTLSVFFENANGKKLAEYVVSQSNHKLYFKQSAYNWIAISSEPAPCYDKKDKQIPQSKVNDFFLISKESAIMTLLRLNGKLLFSQWLTYGDEFDVTKNDLLSAKVSFHLLSEDDRNQLLELYKQFSNEISDTVQFKLNAGKNVGTFNTSKLWHITDKSDMIFLKYLCDNPDEVFEAVENHISQTIKTKESEEEEE